MTVTTIDDLTWRRIAWAVRDMRPHHYRQDLQVTALERARRMLNDPQPSHVSALSCTVPKSFWRHILWAKRQTGPSAVVSYQGHVLWNRVDRHLEKAEATQHTPFFPGGYE